MTGNNTNDSGGDGGGDRREDEIEQLIEPAEAPNKGSNVVVDWSAKISPTPAVEEATPQDPPQPQGASQGEVPPAPASAFEDLIAEEEITESTRRRMRPTPRLVVAVASGKGGVGKSLLAASVSIYLAQLGKKVVLVDAALSSPNLHTLVGVDDPRKSLHDFLRGDVERLEDVLEETPFPSLQLIPGHRNGYASANTRPTQKNQLLSQIRTLPGEIVVIDLDAGTSFNVIDLFLVADLHVVVTLPEPTSIESTFRMIKSAFVRKAAGLPGLKELLHDLRPRAHAGLPTPNQLHQQAKERDPVLGEALHQAMASFKPRLVINKTRTRDDLELGPALTVAGRRHVGLALDYLGYVENDDLAWVTVRRRRPLIVEHPEAKVCKDLERVVRRILSLESKERPECMKVPKPLDDQNHYEILGIHPGATDEEVRRAQRRIRSIYSRDSRAIFGVAPPNEVERMHRRIDEAYGILVDPEKRHQYNQDIFPNGRGLDDSQAEAQMSEGVMAPATPPPLEGLPDMPDIHEATEFTGVLLRQVREARGLEIDDIADSTKISTAYLNAIEQEDFLSTPAPVYLRGFIKTVARELKLDMNLVAASYMARYEAATES